MVEEKTLIWVFILILLVTTFGALLYKLWVVFPRKEDEYKYLWKLLMAERKQKEEWRATSPNPCWHCKKYLLTGCMDCEWTKKAPFAAPTPYTDAVEKKG